jgi:quercetin dioxygenase-like cupin family protein
VVRSPSIAGSAAIDPAQENEMTTHTQNLPALADRVVPPAGGERLWIAGDIVSIKATAADTGGAYTLLEIAAAPGGGPPPHIHVNEDETFYVLEGTFDIQIGDRIVHAGAGSYAFVPRGTVHRFQCGREGPGRLLVMFTPGGLEGFFREAGTPALHDGPPPPVDASEIERTERAGARFGLRVIEWKP